MLRVSLLGNLGADPELRYSQKGAPIASFRVAVNQTRTGPDGERQENTEWFRVRAMGRLADSAQRLAKGMRVLVIGQLDIGHYQSREGDARVSFDVWADEVSIWGRPAGLEGEPLEATEGTAPEAALAGVGAAPEGVSSLGRGERRGGSTGNGASSNGTSGGGSARGR